MQKIDRAKIQHMCLPLGKTIKEAMAVISQGGLGTAFIIDESSRHFIGLITDGDIRRAILKGADLNTLIDHVSRPNPTVAYESMPAEKIKALFGEQVRVIPILNQEQQIVDVAQYDQRFRLPVAQPSLAQKELQYVTDCIVTNWISSTGKYVNQFEELFAKFCQTPYAIATSNGTTALHLALMAYDLGPGDEVIVPSLTFIATANAVTYTGAKPVFVDVDLETWTIDPKAIEAAITPHTKAIIPVHLYGHPSRMTEIMAIAHKHHLIVIEDAAEAHGAKYKDRVVGGIGHMGVFSFFGNKIITTGEGGMIVTHDEALAARMRMLRDHGMSPSRRYWHPVLGYNYRLTNVQAAIGVAQVERVEDILTAKLNVAKQYEQGLKGIKGLILPPQCSWAQNVFWLYSIVIDTGFGMNRDEVMSRLSLANIETRPFFPPVHQQPIYQTQQSLPHTEWLSQNGLSLPSSVDLQERDIQRVCETIRLCARGVHAR